MTYDRTFNIISTDTFDKRSSNINKYGCERMSNEAILEKMKKNHIDEEDKKQEKSKIIEALHEKWAVKNGYRNNDRLNSQNTIGFKNGAEK